jgi:hypothetical protein
MSHERHAERANLRQRLLSGASILMLAPRRIGKTWLLRKVEEDMTAEGWLCILVDVEGKQTEDEFLLELCNAIEKKQGLGKRLLAHLTQRFKQVSLDAKGGSLHEVVGKIDARAFLETLVESLNAEPIRTLILVDEIALFVLEMVRQNPEATSALLYHLRKLQQSYTKVQWFLTGSVGLDVVTQRYGMTGALLDYDSFALDPFTPASARSYVEELCAAQVVPNPFTLSDDGFDQLVQELGWLSPYYLRQIALLIKPSQPASPAAGLPIATRDDVARAAQELLSPQRRMHFAAWREHIVKNFEPAETVLLWSILDIASESSLGEIEATLLIRLDQKGQKVTVNDLRDALNSLSNDGYLVGKDRRWRFQSELLRRFWQEFMTR